MTSFRLVVAHLFVVMATVAVAGTNPLARSQVLSSKERSTIESLTCVQRHKVSATSMQFSSLRRSSGPDRFQVTVRCTSHGAQLGDPAFFEAHCIGRAASWECSDSGLVVQTTIHDRKYEVHSSIEDSVTAVAAIRGLAAQGYYFGQQERRSTDSCYVEPLTASDLYRVSCHGWQAIVSTWCPRKECPRLLESTPMWR
jgi:hypothetical protein